MLNAVDVPSLIADAQKLDRDDSTEVLANYPPIGQLRSHALCKLRTHLIVVGVTRPASFNHLAHCLLAAWRRNVTIDAFLKRAAAAGVTPVVAPTKNPNNGVWLAFIQDPWGTYIEINQRPNQTYLSQM